MHNDMIDEPVSSFRPYMPFRWPVFDQRTKLPLPTPTRLKSRLSPIDSPSLPRAYFPSLGQQKTLVTADQGQSKQTGLLIFTIHPAAVFANNRRTP